MSGMDALIRAFRARTLEKPQVPQEAGVDWRLVERHDGSRFLLLCRTYRDGLRFIEDPDEDFMASVRGDESGFSAWNHPASELL